MAEAQEAPTDPSKPRMDEDLNGDDTAQIADLTAQATLKYSVKDYDAAAELYSQATELQAEINGEMSSKNADLLYAYGRCLYHVAVRNSDVLGSKVAGEKQEGLRKTRGKKPSKAKAIDDSEVREKRVAEEVVTKVAEEKDGSIKPDEEPETSSKPYFQFTGDENWGTSEEEDEDDQAGEDGGDVDEEDDFVNAYEVLDLARVLLLKKLKEVENVGSKAKGESQEARHLKERLADTYDLQAEISLEGEKFPNAVVDLKSALGLKVILYPQESSLIAEAHYKLSLALEFSSVTQQKNENGEVETGKDAQVDESMREEAAQEMEAAIISCKSRIKREEASLSNRAHTNGNAEKAKATRGDIDDVKEMVKEMEQRLVEIRQPPVSMNDPDGMGTFDGSNSLNGILGSMLGETPAAQKARLEEASERATDLTNLVKRKRPAGSEPSVSMETDLSQISGKRKVEFAEDNKEGCTLKRAKVDDDSSR